MTSRTHRRLLSLACLLFPLGAAAAPPVISGCEVFGRKNVWNTPIDSLPVHASSASWVTTIGATTGLHPDFGTFYLGSPIGIPFVTVPGNQPRVPIIFGPEAGDESDPGPYPIPPNAPIEGGGAPGDRHVLVIDRGACVLYELFSSAKQPDNSWTAYSGAIWDLKLNANRPQTWTSADAAGLPILPGLIRYNEVIAGEINHAIRFTVSQTRNTFLWPATHQASGLSGAQYPPMGARFRLKAATNISGYSAQVQVILRALKKYGMILADNGSNWYLSGEHSPLWDDDVLGALSGIKGSDFEAVDTSAMMITSNSTKAFTPPPALALREVASGLAAPLDIANAKDGSGRLFIVEKGGAIKILKNGAVLPTPFFSRAVDTTAERGLLGLAFHPQFATNRRFFVFYNPNDGTGSLQVSSYLAQAGNADLADMASEQSVINIAHPGQSNHNGGKIAFGPDGYLYVATGDGGGGGDTPNNAQNLNVLLGKLLRLDVSGASGYVIPPSNPFVGVAGTRGEIWAYGLRNPWRFSFDRTTGDLYIGDVGQDLTEEIDYQPAGAAGGRNYGWRVYEGPNCYNPPSGCSLANHTPPILSYSHSLGTAVTGGHVYRGRKSRALYGYYLYADSGSSRLWAATRDGNAWGTFQPPLTATNFSGPTGFGEDEAGELYVTSINSGRVFAIDAPGPGVPERVFDLNGNGNDDLLWRHTNGSVVAWLMNGSAPTSANELLPAGTGWSVVQVADFDGDGKSDLLWQHTDGRAVVWLMNGAAPSSTLEILGAGSGFNAIQTADFNGDGKADILWQHPDGRTVIWLMNGTSAFSTREILGAGGGWIVARTGDFNGDGRSDLLWQHPDGRSVLWLMNGTVASSTREILGAGGGWIAKQVADFDGNGKADILWQHPDGRSVIWLMNGLVPTSTQQVLGAGGGWTAARTGDLSGDGKADILWQHPDGRAVIWLMNGVAATSTQQVLGPGGGWSAARLADFNGDGKADIVWQNTNGSVVVWLMNGTALASGADLLGAGTGWSVSTVSQ